ncbi:MAG: hypothetical protein IT350_00935 [Deltaproteobacteria bacterium]|nr:hypothetical protein [Deltaproteobacteria bacterium]
MIREAWVRWAVFAVVSMMVFATGCGCGDDDDDPSTGSGSDDDVADDDATDDDAADDDATDDDAGDDDTFPPLPDDDDDAADDWVPSAVLPIEVHPLQRGLATLRGLIHMHSVYSHDACDGMPFVDGHPNWPCFNQLRVAICTTNQQFVFLTDHNDPFVNYEFPDVLLYVEEEGDELLYEDGDPFANVITCPDGNQAIVTAGNENSLMPLGLRRMPDGDANARSAILDGETVEAINAMKDLGAMVFVPHSEGWTTDQILALPIDGLEVYNLHANIDPSIREDYLGLPSLSFIFDILDMITPLDEAAHADLFLLAFLSESAPARMHWDKVLFDRRTVASIATDAHRNALPFPLLDGDRADSYRRMMRWFANYVLVGERDIETIEEAVHLGRMYGAFQVFGEPVGFDFHAEVGEEMFEMGDEVPAGDSPMLVVKAPTMINMPTDAETPDITIKLWRANGSGGELIESSDTGSIEVPADEAGAYYVTATIVPKHLARWLGDDADKFVREYPLIYANAIYLTAD